MRSGGRGPLGCLAGCLTKLVVLALGAVAFTYVVMVALNPWALHIGGRSTPLLYWHGAGTLVAKDGKMYPLYVSFWPGRPQGIHGGGRREGKIVSAHLSGTGLAVPCAGDHGADAIDRNDVWGLREQRGELVRLPAAGVEKAVRDQPAEAGIL